MIHRLSLVVLFILVIQPLPASWATGGDRHAGVGDHAPAPGFDEKRALAVSQGAIGGVLGDYTLVNRDGRRVGLADYRDRPLVISMIFTSCYHICPTTTRHLAKVVGVARKALGEDSFRVLTIGFDTANDTPVAMAAFAREQGVDDPGWEFLSADADTIARLSRDLGFIFFSSPRGFDHLIQATVIDGAGKVYRQVYDSNFNTPLLVEPLKELVFGAPVSHSLLTDLGNKIRLFCTVYDPASDSYRFDYSLFIGMTIGISTIGLIAILLVREWRAQRRRKSLT